MSVGQEEKTPGETGARASEGRGVGHTHIAEEASEGDVNDEEGALTADELITLIRQREKVTEFFV